MLLWPPVTIAALSRPQVVVASFSRPTAVESGLHEVGGVDLNTRHHLLDLRVVTEGVPWLPVTRSVHVVGGRGSNHWTLLPLSLGAATSSPAVVFFVPDRRERSPSNLSAPATSSWTSMALSHGNEDEVRLVGRQFQASSSMPPSPPFLLLY